MRALGVMVGVVALVLGASAQGVTVTDQAGRAVTVSAPAQRVASVFGVATAYVYVLGAGDRLVGARYLGLPDSPLGRAVMARLDPRWEKIAFPGDVTVEALAALKADLVFAGARHLSLVKLLEEVGIPAAVVSPETFAGVRDTAKLVGTLLGRAAEADRLIAFFDEVIATAKTDTPPDLAPRVLFVGTGPLRVATGGMYQAQLIALAGGRTVTERLPGVAWQDVSPEQILLWDPEVIVIAPYGAVQVKDFVADPVFKDLAAVREERVFKMPQLLFAWDTPIPESILGVLWLSELLYPGNLPLDFREVATQFYQEFYRIELHPAELALIGGK